MTGWYYVYYSTSTITAFTALVIIHWPKTEDWDSEIHNFLSLVNAFIGEIYNQY